MGMGYLSKDISSILCGMYLVIILLGRKNTVVKHL